MKTLLARLRTALGIELVEQQQAGILCIHKPKGLQFKVTVAYDVLEWFVDANDDSGAVWSEWADYYPINGEAREQLVTEMAFDLERFVTILARSEIRVSTDQTKFERVIELKAGDSWKIASLSWMTAEPERNSAQT